MDVAEARGIALKDLPAEEYDHFGKAAYRIKPTKAGAKPGKTFMSLWIEEGHAVLMLNVEQQAELIMRHPGSFSPHPSKWGAKGATIAHLGKLNVTLFSSALHLAFANAKPKKK